MFCCCFFIFCVTDHFIALLRCMNHLFRMFQKATCTPFTIMSVNVMSSRIEGRNKMKLCQLTISNYDKVLKRKSIHLNRNHILTKSCFLHAKQCMKPKKRSTHFKKGKKNYHYVEPEIMKYYKNCHLIPIGKITLKLIFSPRFK